MSDTVKDIDPNELVSEDDIEKEFVIIKEMLAESGERAAEARLAAKFNEEPPFNRENLLLYEELFSYGPETAICRLMDYFIRVTFCFPDVLPTIKDISEGIYLSEYKTRQIIKIAVMLRLLVIKPNLFNKQGKPVYELNRIFYDRLFIKRLSRFFPALKDVK